MSSVTGRRQWCLSEDDYQRLAQGNVAAPSGLTALQWLLTHAAKGKRSKAKIDAGLKARAQLVIAFFDASALIYLIEAREPFASKVRRD